MIYNSSQLEPKRQKDKGNGNKFELFGCTDLTILDVSEGAIKLGEKDELA